MPWFPVPLGLVLSLVLVAHTYSQTPVVPPRDPGTRPAPGGAATIQGRVVDAATGEPLRRAEVSILPVSLSPPERRVTTTDADGRYEFSSVPAGGWRVLASKPSFLTLAFGQRRAGGRSTTVSVTPGQTVTGIDFALMRGGVIAVQITDDRGHPMPGIQVQPRRFVYDADGQRQLSVAGGTSWAGGSTDDLGQVRLYGLEPGEYAIRASAIPAAGATQPGEDAPRESLPPTYYPGTTNPALAQEVAVEAAGETSVHFSLLPARFARIGGTIVDSQGRPAAGAQVILAARGERVGATQARGSVMRDGSFALAGVPSGDYTLDVRHQAGTVDAEFASVPVSVAADLEDLYIVTGRGGAVSGRVRLDAEAAAERLPRLRVQPTAPGASLGSTTFIGFSERFGDGSVGSDGAFTLAGLTGRIFFSVTGAPDLFIRSVVLDGVDVTDVPLDVAARPAVEGLEITLTDRPAVVAGGVVDGSSRPVYDYAVIVQPAAQMAPAAAARFVHVARPDPQGTFELRGIRPGTYLVTAIEALDGGRLYAPAFQADLRRSAVAFTVTEGETVSLVLTLAPDL